MLNRSRRRSRLCDRFVEQGEEALSDAELLEILLYRSVSHSDTARLAHDLLEHFGSFNEVIHADSRRFPEVDGVSRTVAREIKIVRATALRMLRLKTRGRRMLPSWHAIINYVKAAQAFDDKESFRIVFLDKKSQVITDEIQSRGTVDHTPVYIREVISRTLQLAATSIILVHNHPSGDPTPSPADIEMTKLIMAAGSPLGVTVADHIVVGRGGHTSMKATRLI